jgi:hypothetical protein
VIAGLSSTMFVITLVERASLFALSLAAIG